MLDGTDVPQALLAHAAAVDAAMLVMTTVARGAVGRALVGRVADAVVRASPVPVLLLAPQ